MNLEKMIEENGIEGVSEELVRSAGRAVEIVKRQILESSMAYPAKFGRDGVDIGDPVDLEYKSESEELKIDWEFKDDLSAVLYVYDLNPSRYGVINSEQKVIVTGEFYP
jgi:hypothetical protein